MDIADFSIKRPIFTTMVTMIVVLLGMVSLLRLPIDFMPDITMASISISTTYENASPEIVEDLITRPIEEAVAAVSGVEDVTSTSSEGRSSVTARFTWGTDLDEASSDIRDRLDRIIGRLPDDAERPTLFKFDFSMMPIVFLGVASDLDPIEVRRILEDEVKYRLERVPGVASVQIMGGRQREISVDLDADKLKAFGVPVEQILLILRQANINKPAGYIDQGNLEVTLRAPGEYTSVEEVRDTVVAVRNGVPVRLADLADVTDGMQRIRRIVRIDEMPGMRLLVTKQSGSNTVAVADQVMAEVAKIQTEYPMLKLSLSLNTADYIKSSIQNVSDSAVLGGALAVLLVLLFLRNILSTLVIAISIPVSVVATFALLYYQGLTLNLMTLGGLALGVGMLLDNSIVVLENIYRLHEEGMGPADAARNGTNEVFAAIIASTLTTLVVFLPLSFIKGMAGILFGQFALVVTFSLVCSLVVAVTLVPMLAAKVIAAQMKSRGHTGLLRKLFEISERVFLRLESEYKAAISWSLDHRALVVIVSVLALGGSLALAPKIGVEMLPATDEGYLTVKLEMETGIRLDLMESKVKEVEREIVRNTPELTTLSSAIGGSWWRGSATNQADLTARFAPRSERDRLGLRSVEDIASDYRSRFGNLPGMKVRVEPGSSFLGRGMGGGTQPVEVEIRGHDLDIGERFAQQVKDIVSSIDGVVDVRVSRESAAPEKLFRIDRRKAADLRLWVSQIASFLETCIAGTHNGDFRDKGKEYPITVRIKNSELMSQDGILNLTVTNADGKQIALKNVIAVDDDRGPVMIDRKNQQRVVSVLGSLSGRDLGSVMDELRAKMEYVVRPEGFTVDYGTSYQDQQDMVRDLGMGFVLALVLVYMVMACQFESLRDPFVVMFSVPLAAIGVLILLFLTGTTFNIQSMIGCIMLAGIVVNNAILLVDHTNLLRDRDKYPLRLALEESGRRRLRPILMTALTTILGLVPLSLGWGDGGEAQAPMARAVVGGLLSSTFITLIVVPVVYSLVESGKEAKRVAAEAALAVHATKEDGPAAG